MNSSTPLVPSRITCHESNDQLLYFTSSSLLSSGNHLVFISDRSGHPNLVAHNMETGEERQLTDNADGCLKSYVYFDGNEHRGFGKASVSLDADRGIAYYIQGRHICGVDLNGSVRVLAELPADQVTAFTHVSADGTRLCVPTTDARALEYDSLVKGRPGYNIDQRIREEHLSSYIRVFDTDSGEEVLCEAVPEAWVTHVQFHPHDRNVILYNHEWPSDCGIRRVWLWDGERHIRLRSEVGRRSRNDWTCHEMWQKGGSSVIYHGIYANGPSYIGKVNVEDGSIVEIALPQGYVKYGHFTVANGHGDWLVTDGYYESVQDRDAPEHGGRWISVLQVDWEQGAIHWHPLCRHGSNWDSQDSHPHPIFHPNDRSIFFTSNIDGNRAVYAVQVPMEI